MKIVLFAGLMVKRKGIGKILRIAGLLPDITFWLLGDGPLRKRYEKRAARNVTFFGWHNDMSLFYKAADVFLLPSDGEGLPGVVMESMSYGIPCVASDIPCVPDLIDDGVNGYLCDKDNIEEFAMRIKELTDDEKKRKRFGKAAQNKMKKFDWNLIVKKYEELYEVLL